MIHCRAHSSRSTDLLEHAPLAPEPTGRHDLGLEAAGGSYPLPENPALAAVAAGLNEAGHWALVVDDRWRLVYVTEEIRLSVGATTERAEFALGGHMFGTEVVESVMRQPRGPNTMEVQRAWFAALGGLILADTPGGRGELRELVHPEFHDIVDHLSPDCAEVLSHQMRGANIDGTIQSIPGLAIRQRDATGRLAGTVLLLKPAAGMNAIAVLTADADPGHLDRLASMSRAGRRPAAVLMADLEGSSQLSRQMSTAAYFSLVRRLVRTADQCIVDAGGLVGRHVGDGIVAFFPAETSQSESSAARACIAAARALKTALGAVAERSGLGSHDIQLRFGLHWGSTLYVGNITTVGRSEVTALGDEVNETARIEACATGGRTLASKTLLERLEPNDAAALDLDPDHATYTRLADLPTATDKARLDAPTISICDI